MCNVHDEDDWDHFYISRQYKYGVNNNNRTKVTVV